uniref:Uncharacterized protein n=1 Tax=Setaria digitata TaxID=48799 RepID=A0A915PV80_9BILA
MREISSNDYPEQLLPDPSISLIRRLEQSYGRRNSISSMQAISLSPLITTNRHRLLPQIPSENIRRSSSPRFLPTPPLSSSSSSSSTTVITKSDCFLHNWNSEQRQVTGRRLPRTPTDNDSRRLITDRKGILLRQQCSNTANDVTDNIRDDCDTDNIRDNEWPSPTFLQRKFSELRTIPSTDISNAATTTTLFSHISRGTSLRSLQLLSFHKQQQQGSKFSQQQYSFDHSSGTPSSTNAHSQSSSLSPSVEQVLINKASHHDL